VTFDPKHAKERFTTARYTAARQALPLKLDAYPA
jgi:hypothetical protein